MASPDFGLSADIPDGEADVLVDDALDKYHKDQGLEFFTLFYYFFHIYVITEHMFSVL